MTKKQMSITIAGFVLFVLIISFLLTLNDISLHKQEEIKSSIEILIEYKGIVNAQEKELLDCKITSIEKPDNYDTILKFNLNIINSTDIDLCFAVEDILDENIFITNYCIDIEPTYAITSKSNENVTLYAYANSGILVDDTLSDILKQTEISFAFFTVGSNLFSDNYKIVGKWV